MIPTGLALGLKTFVAGAWGALTSPVVWVALGILALGASHAAVYRAGAASAEARCDVAALRQRVTALERDLSIAAAAASSADEKAAELETIAAAAEKQVADYVAELARRDALPRAEPVEPPAIAPPVDACRIDPDDGRRLRAIQ